MSFQIWSSLYVNGLQIVEGRLMGCPTTLLNTMRLLFVDRFVPTLGPLCLAGSVIVIGVERFLSQGVVRMPFLLGGEDGTLLVDLA